MKFLIILSLIALSKAQILRNNNLLLSEVTPDAEPISPYSFSYSADASDGSSTRQESADASGVVRGSYSIISADGIKRIVNYIADENGFRAQVQTNEPGTESKSAADVVMQSSQLPAEEIALKYGPRPDELKPEIRTFGVNKQVIQTLSSPVRGLTKNILLNRPLIDQTLQKSKSFFEILPENKLHPSLLTIPKFESLPIQTPFKLLSRIPKIQTLKTELKPIEFELQKKEELPLSQHYESF